MIQKFVDLFMAHKQGLESAFKEKHPEDYQALVRYVVLLLNVNIDEDEYEKPDHTRITMIDHGDYQGTLLFIIAATGYQPDLYWSVKVSYGSCSGCDTLEVIKDYSDDPPTEQQIKEYLTLCLHIVQGMKKI